jgi:hypothetical protein
MMAIPRRATRDLAALLKSADLRESVHAAFPDIPRVEPKAKPVKVCRICGSTERAPNGRGRDQCAPCRKRINARRVAATIILFVFDTLVWSLLLGAGGGVGVGL